MLRFSLIICLFLLLPVSAQEAEETTVQFIELRGDLAEADAEISSLVWLGESLIFITENPQLYAEDGSFGSFFALEKAVILAYLVEDNPNPLEPYPIPIYADGLLDKLRQENASFDGFEAAVIIEQEIFLQIEANTVGIPPMKSFIISGTIDSEANIHLDASQMIELPVQTNYPNLSYESLFAADGNLIAIYEANGEEANSDTFAYSIDLKNGELSMIAMPYIPYRITDTTEIDAEGNFWAFNYFYPPEFFLGTANDIFFNEFGRGASQTHYDGFVERLLQLHYGEAGIEILSYPPIQLEMTADSYGRNWEGIARLDNDGFLIVTDKFPETLFGFVPLD